MKVLVIGSGGREHALVWKLKQSPRVSRLFCAPGNGGTALCAQNISIREDQIERLKDWALENSIDFTVVGPEKPLELGIVDLFEKSGLRIFGVNQAAARLESSKVFSKRLMQKYHIPTPPCEIFEDHEMAKAYVSGISYPIVIKADGLAAGKGVRICKHKTEAFEALEDCFIKRIFGRSGARVIVEDYVEGEEISYLGLVDGKTFLPLALSQDYKKAFDKDQGPNTGGMGAYSPVPGFDQPWESEIQKKIVHPLLKGFLEEHIRFRGVLYIGLLIQKNVPFVLEFNVRFGDPEAQALLFRLKTDLFPLLLATSEGRLGGIDSEGSFWREGWDPRPAVCVVMASKGYPGKYETGFKIQGLEEPLTEDLALFHGGTVLKNGQVQTAGGRVLSVVARGQTFSEAVQKAYERVSHIFWGRDGMAGAPAGPQYRTDIGDRVCQSHE